MGDAPFPTGKSTISFSEMSTWSECTYRHKLRYIDRIDLGTDSPYNVLGSAVHASCEHFLRTREMDAGIALRYIDDNWSEEVEQARFMNCGEPRHNELPPREDWEQMARDILADVPDFMDETFPGWEFVDAEHRLKEPIERHPELKFKGFIDGIIAVTNKRGKRKLWVIDWKTAGWGWHREKKTDQTVQLQLRLYKHFWAQKMGLKLSDIRTGFVLLKRDGKNGSRCELVTVSMGPTTQQRSLRVLNNFVSSVRHGMFLKNRRACKYCDYYETEHCT